MSPTLYMLISVINRWLFIIFKEQVSKDIHLTHKAWNEHGVEAF